jgi:molybdopterin converting factor small subunit
MNKARVEELRQKIADLKDRWPAHSTSPALMQQLDELEAELEEALREEDRVVDEDQMTTDPHL